jgi:hypothetical protein
VTALCEPAHREWDRLANGPVQVGHLPPWTRIQGRVAWSVWRGPLDMLGEAWVFFHRKVRAANLGRPAGPPGDVFICRPEDHVDDHQASLLTILYLPLAEAETLDSPPPSPRG